VEQKNLDIYGNELIPWSRALTQLESNARMNTWWLSTTRPDGNPHCVIVGAKWVDDKLYFTSSEQTRKSRNLNGNPNCVLSTKVSGLDVVIEGVATRVTDEGTLERIAARYSEDGWPATVSNGAITAPYSAPSAGPPPWDLYEVTPKTAFLLATAEPYGATRFRFN
jgi:pyridoxine/pyridoxamine 5'-phosphate oxidase